MALVSSCLGSVEAFLGSGDVCTDAVAGCAEWLGAPLVGETGRLCGELVQMVASGVVLAKGETGKGDAVGRLCTLSPAVKTQRAKRVLQTMVPGCFAPSAARTVEEFARMDPGHPGRSAPPLSPQLC